MTITSTQPSPDAGGGLATLTATGTITDTQLTVPAFGEVPPPDLITTTPPELVNPNPALRLDTEMGALPELRPTSPAAVPAGALAAPAAAQMAPVGAVKAPAKASVVGTGIAGPSLATTPNVAPAAEELIQQMSPRAVSARPSGPK